VYTPLDKLEDEGEGCTFSQIVLQVRVDQERVYKRVASTLGSKYWPTDLRFAEGYATNEEMEWLTTDPEALQVTGIMIREIGNVGKTDLFGDAACEFKYDEDGKKAEYQWIDHLAENFESVNTVDGVKKELNTDEADSFADPISLPIDSGDEQQLKILLEKAEAAAKTAKGKAAKGKAAKPAAAEGKAARGKAAKPAAAKDNRAAKGKAAKSKPTRQDKSNKPKAHPPPAQKAIAKKPSLAAQRAPTLAALMAKADV